MWIFKVEYVLEETRIYSKNKQNNGYAVKDITNRVLWPSLQLTLLGIKFPLVVWLYGYLLIVTCFSLLGA